MNSRHPAASPQTYARVGGALYLFIIVAALFGEAYVRGSLLVPRDPAATAGHILGSETLFRIGLAGEMLTCVCDVALTLILCCILFGHLIRHSRYLPEILGTLLAIGGVGYVAFSLTQIVDPVFAARYLFPWLMLPAFPAELGLALWLTVKGVDVPTWNERARA